MTRKESFMVIVRDDPDTKFLYPVIHEYQVKRHNGKTAHVLWCRSIDSSQGAYLHVEAKLLESDGYVQISIPHWLVFSIVGSKDLNQVGFLWAAENHEPPPS